MTGFKYSVQLQDQGVEVEEIIPISDNVMYVNCHGLKEAIAPQPYTSVVIAAFVQSGLLSCIL